MQDDGEVGPPHDSIAQPAPIATATQKPRTNALNDMIVPPLASEIVPIRSAKSWLALPTSAFHSTTPTSALHSTPPTRAFHSALADTCLSKLVLDLVGAAGLEPATTAV